MLGDAIPAIAVPPEAPVGAPGAAAADGDPAARGELIEGVKADLVELGILVPEVRAAEEPGANAPAKVAEVEGLTPEVAAAVEAAATAVSQTLALVAAREATLAALRARNEALAAEVAALEAEADRKGA